MIPYFDKIKASPFFFYGPPKINELLSLMRYLCPVEALTLETHEQGIRIARQYKLSTYDAMIVAAAMIAGCKILYSENMQNGLLVDERVRIRSLFIPGSIHAFS